jgi:hypothetical protein
VGIPLQFAPHEGYARVASEHVLERDSKKQPILIEPTRPKSSHMSRIIHECIAKNRLHQAEVIRDVTLDSNLQGGFLLPNGSALTCTAGRQVCHKRVEVRR